MQAAQCQVNDEKFSKVMIQSKRQSVKALKRSFFIDTVTNYDTILKYDKEF